MKKNYYIFLLLISLVACTKEQDWSVSKSSLTSSYSGKYVRDYFTLLCKISKSTPGFFPPQVARAYGYVGIANYEAVVHGINSKYTLVEQLNGLHSHDYAKYFPAPFADQEYNWSLASNAAIADMIRKMFDKKITAANLASVDSLEKTNYAALSASVSAEVSDRSVKFGQDISAAIYQYSVTDGGHESYMDPFQLPYTMPPDPWCWIPTGAVLTPVSPYWGKNRPMIRQDLTNTQEFTPITYSTNATSDFYKAAMDVYNQVKVKNTAEEVTIAKYWSDDPFNTCTPAGHTFNIMTQLLLENNATLEKTSVAYAKLCIAEMDAFIACWKTKYDHILIRPVSYIKKYIDPTFTTVIGTPAFPSYSSGHSYEIGAGAKIFTDMFTDGSGNYNFTDYSQLQYGFAARTYTNFNKMARECANSRFYAGIHYAMDNEDGIDGGSKVGDNVLHLLTWPQNTK